MPILPHRLPFFAAFYDETGLDIPFDFMPKLLHYIQDVHESNDTVMTLSFSASFKACRVLELSRQIMLKRFNYDNIFKETRYDDSPFKGQLQQLVVGSTEAERFNLHVSIMDVIYDLQLKIMSPFVDIDLVNEVKFEIKHDSWLFKRVVKCMLKGQVPIDPDISDSLTIKELSDMMVKHAYDFMVRWAACLLSLFLCCISL